MALTIADSKAVFSRKLKEYGLLDKQDAFTAAGFTTHAELAYAFNFVPGQSNDDNFQALCDTVLGPVTADNTQIRKPALRRLHFESYTIAIKHIQQLADKPEDEVRPAKIPVPEREARFKEFKRKYSGLNIENELEPSNTLIDKIHTMRTAGLGPEYIAN